MKLKANRSSVLWSRRGCELDIERGTQFGTLGYLPVEIRRTMWEHVIEQDWLDYVKRYPYEKEWLANCQTKDPFCQSGAHQHRPKIRSRDQLQASPDRTSQQLRCASPDVAAEVDQIMFSKFLFSIESAKYLVKLLDRVRFLERKGFGSRIPLRLEIRLLKPADWSVRYEGETPWSKAFKWLPSSLEAVRFVLNWAERDPTPELLLMECLHRRIAEHAPGAVTTIEWSFTWDWRERYGPQLSDDVRALFESHLQNNDTVSKRSILKENEDAQQEEEVRTTTTVADN